MSEDASVSATERWERLRNVRQIFMAVTILCGAVHVLTVLDAGRSRTLLDILIFADIGSAIGAAGWIVAGLMERKARKTEENMQREASLRKLI